MTRPGWAIGGGDGEGSEASVIGGGSAPGYSIPTRLIALRHGTRSAAVLEKRLLAHRPPVIARVEADAVLLDLRTVLPHQEAFGSHQNHRYQGDHQKLGPVDVEHAPYCDPSLPAVPSP